MGKFFRGSLVTSSHHFPSDEGKALITHPDVFIRGVQSTVHRTREAAEARFAEALGKGEVEVLEITPDMRRRT